MLSYPFRAVMSLIKDNYLSNSENETDASNNLSNSESETESSKKLKEVIIEFVKHFKDLKKEEINEKGRWTERIKRLETCLNFQPPYTIYEVTSFEERNGIKLPKELKTYLTEISRSIFCKTSGADDFCIIDLKNNENLRKDCVLVNILHFNRNKLFSSEDEDEEDEDDQEDEDEVDDPLLDYHGMMHIRRVGCGYSDKIILNGKFEGSVWNESFVGDGPITLINDSFYRYVCKTSLINTED